MKYIEIIKVICLCLSAILLLSCCSNDSNRITEGVYFYNSGGMNTIPEGEDKNVKLIKTDKEAKEIIPRLKAKDDLPQNYDEKYFSENDLLLITFPAGVDEKYFVKSISFNDDALKVIINEEKPEDRAVYRDLLIYRTAFITFEKGYLPEDVKFDVTINEWDK